MKVAGEIETSENEAAYEILKAALNIVFDQNAFEDGRQRVIVPQATGSWMVATSKDGKLGVTGFYKTASSAFLAIKEQMKERT